MRSRRHWDYGFPVSKLRSRLSMTSLMLLQVCILAHERGPMGGGCALLFGIQTTLGACSGPGCQLIPYVESGAPGRVESEERLRPFPAPGAWQGIATATVAQWRSGGIRFTACRFRVITPPFAWGL